MKLAMPVALGLALNVGCTSSPDEEVLTLTGEDAVQCVTEARLLLDSLCLPDELCTPLVEQVRDSISSDLEEIMGTSDVQAPLTVGSKRDSYEDDFNTLYVFPGLVDEAEAFHEDNFSLNPALSHVRCSGLNDSSLYDGFALWTATEDAIDEGTPFINSGVYFFRSSAEADIDYGCDGQAIGYDEPFWHTTLWGNRELLNPPCGFDVMESALDSTTVARREGVMDVLQDSTQKILERIRPNDPDDLAFVVPFSE